MGIEKEVWRNNEYFKDMDLSHSYDGLSGLLNRDAMLGYVDWLISKGHKFSFFLIDIDNFKNVNDTYGHMVGDKVINQTAQYFVRLIGEHGVVARYGGDEFLVAFDGVYEYNDVWQYGHLIDMNIGGVKFEGIPNLAVTVSIGIARYPLNATNREELLTVADKALYRAKMKGRNCFIIYLPEKHGNISLDKNRDKKLTAMQQCCSVFSSLTACGENLSLSIATLFRSLISNYMFDHICLETHNGINHSTVFTLSLKKDFDYIDYKKIEAIMNSAGYMSINQTAHLNNESYANILKDFEQQGIMSTLYCKIAAYGKEYGFIRVDTVSTARIWQNTEITMVMFAANAIALLLHYQNLTLEDLPLVDVVEVGGTD